MVGYHQTNQKTDTGKTLTRWPVLVDHNILSLDKERLMDVLVRHYDVGDAGIEQIINDFWDGMVSDR